jgi:hypothetical protein
VFLYAFDLIELDGEDLRRDPLAVRKTTLASLLARAAPGLRFTEHMDEEDGPLVFSVGNEAHRTKQNSASRAVTHHTASMVSVQRYHGLPQFRRESAVH